MLKATKVQAVTLQLPGGEQAVLVQDGREWNGLRNFKCVAPPQCAGQTIIAVRENNDIGMAAVFREVFNTGDNEHWVVVMASPEFMAICRGDAAAKRNA